MRIEAGKISKKRCLELNLAFDDETNEIIFPDNAEEVEETRSMKFATLGAGDRYFQWPREDLSGGGIKTRELVTINQRTGFTLMTLEERSPYLPPQDSEALRYLNKKFPAQEWSTPQ